jgi:DNA-directed RNA polymerase subunit RPC12/RpoP
MSKGSRQRGSTKTYSDNYSKINWGGSPKTCWNCGRDLSFMANNGHEVRGSTIYLECPDCGSHAEYYITPKIL